MTTPHYYLYPFGQNADDLTAIPDNPPLDGSVSYFYGWTDPYEYDLTTNPAALPIPRGQMNQLFFDITNNLQEYQQFGSPQWVVGNTVMYPIFARVYYTGQVYENQVANNTATPGADNTWIQISQNAQGVPSGSMLPFGGTVQPTGYLLCNGAAYNRVTFAALFAAITQVQNGVTTNTMTSVTGLTDTSQMYVGMAVEGAGIQTGTTIAVINSGTAITLSAPATASATVPLTFFNWGNGNGTTTFNVPLMNRRVPMGAGGSPTATIYNAVGSIGGEEAHVLTVPELAAHTHPPLAPGTAFDNFLTPAGAGGNLVAGNQHVATATTGSTGSSVAHNTIQPSVITNYIIKI